jgi:hypothetical protein
MIRDSHQARSRGLGKVEWFYNAKRALSTKYDGKNGGRALIFQENGL